jgi:hypothetical protein
MRLTRHNECGIPTTCNCLQVGVYALAIRNSRQTQHLHLSMLTCPALQQSSQSDCNVACSRITHITSSHTTSTPAYRLAQLLKQPQWALHTAQRLLPVVYTRHWCHPPHPYTTHASAYQCLSRAHMSAARTCNTFIYTPAAQGKLAVCSATRTTRSMVQTRTLFFNSSSAPHTQHMSSAPSWRISRMLHIRCHTMQQHQPPYVILATLKPKPCTATARHWPMCQHLASRLRIKLKYKPTATGTL